MSVDAFLAGFLLGFVGSVPIAGPISLVVVDSTLENRPREALSVAIGAAIAESVYAALAFWGLARLFNRFPTLAPLSRVLAGAVLLGVGLYFAIRRSRRVVTKAPSNTRAWRHAIVGFVLTICNPTLIATWTAALAVVYGTAHLKFTANGTTFFATGACSGIIAWFYLLIRIICRIKNQVRHLDYVVRAMGMLLFGIGMYLTIRSVTAH